MRLWIAGALSILLYARLLWLDAVNGLRPVLEFLAILAALFLLYAWASSAASKMSWKVAFLWAALFRIVLLPAGLPAGANLDEKIRLLTRDWRGEAVTYERFQLYDNDIWRYLWDGHVTASGRNPYTVTPAGGEALAGGVWRDVLDNVSYPETPTIYPPLAQLAFAASTALRPASLLAMKLLITLFDLGAMVFLALTLHARGINPAVAVLYGWNPLVVKVFAGSGHVDALAVCALAAGGYFLERQQGQRAAVAFGLAILAKLSPAILLPLLIRRLKAIELVVLGGIVTAGYAPFAPAGAQMFEGFVRFSRFWEFNAGPLNFVRWLAPWANPRLLCGLLLAGCVLWVMRRDDASREGFSRRAAGLLGLLVVFSPAAMPWYASWGLPYAALARRWIWFAFSALVCAAFGVMVDGTERSWVLAIEYGGFAAAWFWLERAPSKGVSQ